MAQWVNRLWNNIFVNPPPLATFIMSRLVLCEISGALHLASRQAGWLAGRRNTGKFRNFQNWLWAEIFEFSLRLTKIHHHYSLTIAFQWVFLDKAYCKVDLTL